MDLNYSRRLLINIKGAARDIKSGLEIIPQAWSLYIIIIILIIANLVVWSTHHYNELFANITKNVAIILCLLVVIVLLGRIYHQFIYNNIEGASLYNKKLTRFIVYYNSLNIISRLVDLLMIGLIIKYSLWIEIIIILPFYFFICLWCMVVYDKFRLNGYDLLQINYFRLFHSPNLQNHEKRITEKKLIISLHWLRIISEGMLKWFLKSRKRIFLFGSIFLLEPDIVTLLLRKEQRISINDLIKITLPSNIICISFWSIIFYIGLQGYNYAIWFVEW